MATEAYLRRVCSSLTICGTPVRTDEVGEVILGTCTTALLASFDSNPASFGGCYLMSLKKSQVCVSLPPSYCVVVPEILQNLASCEQFS